jgi:hypothetical protein
MPTNEQVVEATRKWITDVVIGLNFCPFAAREMKLGTVHFSICGGVSLSDALAAFSEEAMRLNITPEIETTLLIFPEGFVDFEDYLDLVTDAETWLKKNKYNGVYQVASFHPEYLFSGSTERDAANYTNRSPYPMLHLLREESLTKVLEKNPHTEQIPENNISLARKKGLLQMKSLLQACMP